MLVEAKCDVNLKHEAKGATGARPSRPQVRPWLDQLSGCPLEILEQCRVVQPHPDRMVLVEILDFVEPSTPRRIVKALQACLLETGPGCVMLCGPLALANVDWSNSRTLRRVALGGRDL